MQSRSSPNIFHAYPQNQQVHCVNFHQPLVIFFVCVRFLSLILPYKNTVTKYFSGKLRPYFYFLPKVRKCMIGVLDLSVCQSFRPSRTTYKQETKTRRDISSTQSLNDKFHFVSDT